MREEVGLVSKGQEVGLGQSSLQLPRLFPQWMLPWVRWDKRRKWPHTVASPVRETLSSEPKGLSTQNKRQDACTPLCHLESQGLVYTDGPLPEVANLGPPRSVRDPLQLVLLLA